LVFSPVLSFESLTHTYIFDLSKRFVVGIMKSSQTAVFAVFKKIFELTPKKVVFL